MFVFPLMVGRGMIYTHGPFDHTRTAGPKSGPSEPSVRADPRRGSGSARVRLPDGGWRGRPPNARIVQQWHAEKANLKKDNLDVQTREDILYRLADICTALMRQAAVRRHPSIVGAVARLVGGGLVAPTTDPGQIQKYFGQIKGFKDVDELIAIVTGGVPVCAAVTSTELNHALQYGNHRSALEHLPAIWEKLSEDVRRDKCLVIRKSFARQIPNLRVSLLGAVVTHKVRIINDLSFELRHRNKKGGLNRDTDSDSVPPCLRATTLPKFLTEIVSLRQQYPVERILMSKADVSDVFRNVRVDPDQAHNFCYTIGDLVVIDLRLTFGWSGSPGFWGVMASAAEHSHCHTSVQSAQLLSEGRELMSHVKIVDR